MRILQVLFALLIAGSALAEAPTELHAERAYCGGDHVEVQHLAVSVSADTNLVAAVSGKHVRLMSYVLVPQGAVGVRWQSTNADAESGVMALPANGILSANCGPIGCLRTTDDTGLRIDVDAAVLVAGHVTYLVCDN